MSRNDKPYIRRSSPLVHSQRCDYIVAADRRTVCYRASSVNKNGSIRTRSKSHDGTRNAFSSWDALETVLNAYNEDTHHSRVDTTWDEPSPATLDFNFGPERWDPYSDIEEPSQFALDKVEPRSIFDIFSSDVELDTPSPERLTTQRQSTVSPHMQVHPDAFDNAINNHQNINTDAPSEEASTRTVTPVNQAQPEIYRRSPVRSLFDPMRGVRRRSLGRQISPTTTQQPVLKSTGLLRERLEERSRNAAMGTKVRKTEHVSFASDPDTSAAELLRGIIPCEKPKVRPPTPSPLARPGRSLMAFKRALHQQESWIPEDGGSVSLPRRDLPQRNIPTEESDDYYLSVDTSRTARLLLHKYYRPERESEIRRMRDTDISSKREYINENYALVDDSIEPLLKRLEQKTSTFVIPDYDRFIAKPNEPSISRPRWRAMSPDEGERSDDILSDIEISRMISSNTIPNEQLAFSRSMTQICAEAEEHIESDDEDMNIVMSIGMERNKMYSWERLSYDINNEPQHIEVTPLKLPPSASILDQIPQFDMKGTLYDEKYFSMDYDLMGDIGTPTRVLSSTPDMLSSLPSYISLPEAQTTPPVEPVFKMSTAEVDTQPDRMETAVSIQPSMSLDREITSQDGIYPGPTPQNTLQPLEPVEEVMMPPSYTDALESSVAEEPTQLEREPTADLAHARTTGNLAYGRTSSCLWTTYASGEDNQDTVETLPSQHMIEEKQPTTEIEPEEEIPTVEDLEPDIDIPMEEEPPIVEDPEPEPVEDTGDIIPQEVEQDKTEKKKKRKKKKKKKPTAADIESRPRPLRYLVDKQLKEGFKATVFIVTSKKNATSSLCTIKFDYEEDRLILETPSNVFDIDASKVVAEELPTATRSPGLLKLNIQGKKSSAVVIQCAQERNLNVLGGTIGWANAMLEAANINTQKKDNKKEDKTTARLDGSSQHSQASADATTVTPEEHNVTPPMVPGDTTPQKRSLLQRVLLRRRMNKENINE
ncbi:hypothetical protein BBOV_III005990 [Babesia bovis T2Bo]|uniref:Uncharacterized protein n=1 Tax=Babesia bovis TaxID=5865 RepID=A7ANM6_BABBO|nr:hypothetical protein BBOV_III005990 [Babesia bovis T2Bo]EDO08160.1 hypothetical protein BBOV_III005990 [Babesia bovis T2Bo]|eukprot:XP_001611728.1 hypothetical protein [Babesia bovis T2Bo]